MNLTANKELDEPVIEMNEWALQRLKNSEKELQIIPNATHLFEEPGALEDMAHRAESWFERYLEQKAAVKTT